MRIRNQFRKERNKVGTPILMILNGGQVKKVVRFCLAVTGKVKGLQRRNEVNRNMQMKEIYSRDIWLSLLKHKCGYGPLNICIF